MAKRISYEDARDVSNQLTQCATNIRTGVNSPLQGRTAILDLDLLRTNSSSTENTYYQSQLADKINNQTTDIISFVTKILAIHLNLGQNLTMTSSQSFVSLEAVSPQSLENKIISLVGNAQFQLPTYHLSLSSSVISIRVCFYFEFINQTIFVFSCI